MFHDWIAEILKIVTLQHVLKVATAVLFMLLGIFLSRRVDTSIDRLNQLDISQKTLFGKIGKYGILVFAVAAALNQLGFNLEVLLGAAGVLTVAIGFAAQTSASNLISGLFLMVERPFVVGDIVQIGVLTGTVLSIDLLSSKIKTFDNLMVRIPNETMVKSNITNQSYFPVRRVDFNLPVPYSTDLNEVESLLRGLADGHHFCLDEPGPVFIVSGFADSAINLQFQVWTLASNMLTVQNELFRQIHAAFRNAKIEAAYPTRVVRSFPENQV
jgi:small-conductance mechanosensitive channel